MVPLRLSGLVCPLWLMRRRGLVPAALPFSGQEITSGSIGGDERRFWGRGVVQQPALAGDRTNGVEVARRD